jgi:hypothetical protein
MDTLEERVANVRTLMLLPKSTKSRMLIAELLFMRWKMDIVDPHCMLPRSENVEPNMEKSKTDRLDPRRVQAKQLVAEPNLPLVLKLKQEEMLA